MAATNFTPISLYYSSTATNVPLNTNLVAGELALNTADEKLYFKNSAGTVKLLASNAASSGTVSSVAATVPSIFSISGSPITTSGTLAITYSGTALPVLNGGTGVTTSTGSGNVVLSTSPTLTTPVLSGTTTTASGNLVVQPATYILEVRGGGSTVGQIQLNCPVNTHGQIIASQPHSEAATNILTLPGGTTIGNANAVLVSNTGTQTLTNKTIAFSSNTFTGALPVANGGTGSSTLAGAGIATLTGSETLTNKTLTNPTVTNYVETPFSANSSTAITLALTNGTVQIITLTGNATITMPTATSGKSFTLLLKQDATGSRTVTWSSVQWPSGTAPTITATASKMDKYVFIADGTYWYGSTAGQNYTY